MSELHCFGTRIFFPVTHIFPIPQSICCNRWLYGSLIWYHWRPLFILLIHWAPQPFCITIKPHLLLPSYLVYLHRLLFMVFLLGLFGHILHVIICEISGTVPSQKFMHMLQEQPHSDVWNRFLVTEIPNAHLPYVHISLGYTLTRKQRNLYIVTCSNVYISLAL